ncbi:MAG: glycosyltransferase family 2 protein [Microbacteriaceae bacterium]|nr:glycosyltransferase family 2 protein [Microbacteriaceae bacterium]
MAGAEPVLSVLMPARNAAGTVLAAVRSTLRAMPAEAELLVLDDASDDGTGELVRGVGDARVRVIRSDENVGIARGLTRLLGEARASVVARMDADDVCLPTRFRAQLAALDRGADLVFTTFGVIGAGMRLPALPVPFGPVAGRLALLLDCPYPHSTALARTETLRSLGGYRPSVAEDYDLWLRAAASGARIVRLGRAGVLLRVSAGQVTADPGYRSRLAADPLVAESYLALARELWGVDETPWLRELSFLRQGALTREGQGLLEPFVHRFIASLGEAAADGGIGAGERWYLSRRARQELGVRARRA